MTDLEICELVNMAFYLLDSNLSLANKDDIDYMKEKNEKIKNILIKLEKNCFKEEK